MAISKKKDSPYYYTRFSICGVRVQESTKCTSKGEAQQYEDKRRNEIRKHVMLGKKPERTWAEAALRWLEVKQGKKSLDNDIGHLEWLAPHLNHCYMGNIDDEKIKDITEKRLAAMYGKKNKDGKIVNLKKTSPATTNRMLEIVKAIFNMARDDWKWITEIPTIKKLPEPKKRVRWLTHEQVEKLLKELPEHLRVMTQFSLVTGLRASNVRRLLWQDVDMKRQLTWVHFDEAKGKKSISVPLNKDAIEILKQQIGIHDEYVFVYRGHPVGKCSTRAWQKALQRAKIKNFRWHDLRHTWASWHLQNGTTLPELRELGKWSSYDMVDRYAHLADSHLKKAASNVSLKSKSIGAKSVQKEK